MAIDRRTFLQLLSTGAATTAFPASIARAFAIPANNSTGTIQDVEHIVFMMQENRSFDHYFGTLRGVRGYGDPRAIKLPNGSSVWYQPDGEGSYVLPFHPPAPNLGLQFLEDLAHDWTSTHAAWNGGNHDQWVPNKGATTMAHLTRSDIPFHYALADAFTVCDAYHCSLLGPTDPNRYHMWTGWVGNDGAAGGPVIDNAEAGYDWSTYPERLQKAGISWKIYQDQGVGLTADGYWGWTEDAYIGNYGDNSLLYFHQYQNAPANSPLAEKARTGTNISASGTLFDIFKADVKNGTLPQVSWIVAPEAYTEHPNWPANYGAWYVSQILDALTDNPDVWSKTAFFLTYDENDGFFDHMVPLTPPSPSAPGYSNIDTTNEYFAGDSSYPPGPYGLGVRVPMVVISPWSKGGWVNSEVFDHTSLIRFIERRFGGTNPEMIESNITPWRRAITGNLTSAFNFAKPNSAEVPLPSTVSYAPPDNNRHPDYQPTPPAVQAMPQQESGVRPARAVPYELHVEVKADFTNHTVQIHLDNTGQAASVLQIRSGVPTDPPRVYTLAAGTDYLETWPATKGTPSTYDLSVYGPNGFLRAYQGTIAHGKANLEIRTAYDGDHTGIQLWIENHGSETVTVKVLEAYSRQTTSLELESGKRIQPYWSLKTTYGWYDFTVTVESDPSFSQQVAGHVEAGKDSMTDPAIGAS
jgi:phospholipase C